MTLELKGVAKTQGGQVHIHPTDLVLEHGTMNVLLGPTLSGKTTLMRLMAGLDAPTAGRIFWDGKDVTGMRVQDRRVAMVYQQFINYPSMSVYDNIASPLRLMARDRDEISTRVGEVAEMLKLTPYLNRASAGTVRRPAAALRAGAGAGEGRRSGAAGRTAGQSRLQAARGTARRDPPHLRRIRRDLRLCHHRAGRGAAAWRQ